MKILKLAVVVCLGLSILIGFPMSNVRASNIQIRKKVDILNTLRQKDLILSEIKQLDKHNQNETLCVALNMYHEARGSTVKDQIAATYVVFNRYNSDEYPMNSFPEKSLCNIIFDRWQFCWTNDFIVKSPKEQDAWTKSQKLAIKLLSDKTHRKLAKQFELKHYVVTPLLTDKNRPIWINKRKLTIKVGKHSYMAIKENIDNTKENQLKYSSIIDKGYNLIFPTEIKPIVLLPKTVKEIKTHTINNFIGEVFNQRIKER